MLGLSYPIELRAVFRSRGKKGPEYYGGLQAGCDSVKLD